ncbi:hypothetical protein FOCC_FOCC016629 [Frankliniella occidentalis]|nr:hypothetical protein FOCC_FOCC016629 [Frankliniella occidentalis]
MAVYCGLSLLLGVPLALLEVGLGQLCEQGVTRVWRAVPLFTGVGVVKVLLSALLSVYWPVLMALSLFFAVWTAKGPLPFSECKYSDGADGYLYSRTSGESCLKKTFLKSPAEEPMWFSVTATFLFLLWTITLLCVFRGARTYRRVLSVLVVALVAGLVAMLVDSAMLPGADVGLQQLLRFDWDALLNVETWYFATIQIFFSTHIGLGSIVTGAGRFYSKSNAIWTAFALVLCSLLVGVLWVAIIYLRLGQLVQSNQLRQLVSSDIPETMVLTLLYDTAAKGNSDQTVAAIGFLLIVCAGFASMVPLLDTILSAIYVESKRRWEWWKAAALCCILGFVLGALCMLPEFLSLIHVLDHYVVGRLALACTVTELVAFVWIYGCGPLYTDLEFVVGSKLGPLWKILWCLAPLYLLAVEAWSVVVIPWDGLTGRHDPPWQVLLGWGLYFAGWAIICVTAVRQVCIQVDYNICQKFLSAVKPSRNWGPADPIYRHCWMQWRDATPANKMDHTLRRRGTRDYTHSVRMATAPDPLSHFSHLAPSRGSGPFFIDSKAELAEHVCWRKEMLDKPLH